MSDWVKRHFDRGTGRTTRQMLDAPHKATFVWCNDILESAQHLAAKVGREDLKIVAPSYVGECMAGLKRSMVVVDHATYLTPDQQLALLRLPD